MLAEIFCEIPILCGLIQTESMHLMRELKDAKEPLRTEIAQKINHNFFKQCESCQEIYSLKIDPAVKKRALEIMKKNR